MRIGNVYIGPGLLLLLAVFFLFDTDGVFYAFLAAAVLHEAGHAIAVYLAGGRVHLLRLGLLGGEMQVEAPLSYGREAFVAAAGPGMNLITAYLASTAARILLPAGPVSHALLLFSGVSIVTALFNLLPVRPLDGGSLLYALAARYTDFADAVSTAVGLLVSAAVTAAGMLLFMRSRYNFSLLLTGLYTLSCALRQLQDLLGIRRRTRRTKKEKPKRFVRNRAHAPP